MKLTVFTKDQTAALKGLATMMLVLHHSFQQAWYYDGFAINFMPFSESFVVKLAVTCKICVAIFAFISGYGLFLSCIKEPDSPDWAQKWVYERYIKTFSGYWFVWIASIIVCHFLNNLPAFRYFADGRTNGCLYMLLDFMGVASLFATPMLNGSWWYMSAALVFILITPILAKNKNNLLWIALLVVVFPRVISGTNGDGVYTGQNSAYAFLGAFLAGCIFARYHLFDTIASLKYKPVRFVLELCLILALYKMYHIIPASKFWEIRFALFPVVVIVFLNEFVLNIPVLRNILRFVGKHSMNIFMTHTFISGTFLRNFIYSHEHWLLIFGVLLILSILLSLAIELIKKITRYDFCVHKWLLS